LVRLEAAKGRRSKKKRRESIKGQSGREVRMRGGVRKREGVRGMEWSRSSSNRGKGFDVIFEGLVFSSQPKSKDHFALVCFGAVKRSALAIIQYSPQILNADHQAVKTNSGRRPSPSRTSAGRGGSK